MGGGAALGGAMKMLEPAFQSLANRVARSFLPPTPTLGTSQHLQELPPSWAGPHQGPMFGADVGPMYKTPPTAWQQIRGLAAAGDEQAQLMLQYMAQGQPELAIPLHPEAPSPAAAPGMEPPAGSPVPNPQETQLGQMNTPFLEGMPGPRPERVPSVPEVGQMRGPTNIPVAGLASEDWMPTTGLRPERMPFGLPETGRMRGPTNTPVQGLMDEVTAADNLAASMNKASTIIESPDFPKIAAQVQVDEVAVSRAAQATNPGGSNLVQGVTNPAEFASQQVQHTRFARRGTRLDAMISDEPITDQMVSEYESHGVYTGQRVLTSEGTAATIRGFENGRALLEPIYTGAPFRRQVSDLHPLVTSPGSREVPQLWSEFGSYVENRTGAVAQAMGGGITPEQLQTVRQQNIAQYMEDFFETKGITNPGDKARIRSYFNERYVLSFMQAEPEAAATQQAATAHSAAVADATPLPKVQRLDRHAATKGFVAIPEGETGRWMLLSNDPTGQAQTRTQVLFDSMEAAEEWVKKVNRELPDVTPASEVPIEIQAVQPTEPQQGPNLNEQTPEATVSSIHELSNSEGGVPPTVPPEVHAAEGNLGRLRNTWLDGFTRWLPARRLFSKIDQALHEAGNPTGIAADYDMLSNRLVMHHNEMHPYMDELTDIMRPIKTAHLVDGTWTRIYELADRGARDAAAEAAGFSPKEKASLDQFEVLMQKLFPNTSLEDIRQIPRYISHIAQRQSTPELMSRAFEDFPLGPTTRPFYDYVRSGNLNAREMDPRVLGETYIRAVFWQKNMAEPFNATVAKWKELAKIPELAPAETVMSNWMKIIRHGYQAEDDIALDTMHAAMRVALGPSVTRQQAREVFNFGLNATHSGLLGYRLNVMARDALQLFFAIPRAGVDLISVMGRYSSSAEARAKVWNDALEAGAIALQSPRMAAPGTLGGEMEAIGGALTDEAVANMNRVTPDPSRRMVALAKVTNAVRDLMPDVLKDTRDSALHPMYLYGKQSELMRALTFTAGRDKAARALTSFRAAGAEGSMDALMGESGARTYDPSWQRQFQQLVASGNDKEAANYIGRQLADATQFKYGQVESPYTAKSVTGRVAMQFGNYSMQYMQYLRESLANGHWTDKVKWLATAGAVTAGLEAASRKTGWNFRLMNPYYALGFTGGPWIGLTASLASGVNSMMRGTMGADVQPGGPGAAMNALGQAGSIMNPLGGIWQNAKAIGLAAESPNPAMTFLQSQVTGERTLNPAINAANMESSQAMFQSSLMPLTSPMRAGGYGTQTPPQMPSVYPTEISGGSPGNSGVPTVSSPPPGGQPSGYRPANPAQIPPPEVLSQLGVTDPSRVYFKDGRLVYDSQNVGPDGHVGTYVLNEARNVLRPGQTWEQKEQELMSAPASSFHNTKIITDLRQLDPQMQPRVQYIQQEAAKAGIRLTVAETVRPQSRQEYEFAQGRNPAFPGPIHTWTLTSNHASGRGVDFIVNGDTTGKDPGYAWLWQIAPSVGLIPLKSLDPGHLGATDSSLAAPMQYPAASGANPRGGGGGAFF